MLWCAAPFQISGISTGPQGAGAGSAEQLAPWYAGTAQGDGGGSAGQLALTVPVPAGKPPFPR
jgi:hypothetical protein